MDLRSELLALDDLQTKQVTVPVWNRKVRIREMGLQESLAMLSSDNLKDGRITLDADDFARIISHCVIDDDGKRVFTDKDVPVLARKNRRALMFLYNEITGLSGSVEDAEKN